MSAWNIAPLGRVHTKTAEPGGWAETAQLVMEKCAYGLVI